MKGLRDLKMNATRKENERNGNWSICNDGLDIVAAREIAGSVLFVYIGTVQVQYTSPKLGVSENRSPQYLRDVVGTDQPT